MILNEIEEKLRELDDNVFYGAVDNSMRETVWNYTIFQRNPTKRNPNKTGYSYYFSVHVVRENFIPEGLDIEYIKKMEEIQGIRLADAEMQYNYTVKPNTNVIVEMLSMTFVRPVKV